MNRTWPILLGIVLGPSVAEAVNPADWSVVEQINRGDTTKTWVSPTAVDLNHDGWLYEFEITRLTATVRVLFDITVDITDQIPPEYRLSSGQTHDLPQVLIDETLADAGSGTSADVFVEIDSLGFGRAVFDNIVLGNVVVEPFGSLPIRRINFEANVTLTGFDFAEGDYNGDGLIDAADYLVWRRSLGSVGPRLPADGNDNNAVEIGDYTVWNQHFGQLGAGVASQGASVPEPSAAVVLFSTLAAVSLIRRRVERGYEDPAVS